MNVARAWIGHEYFNPDTESIYKLDDKQFTKTDLLLELAKKYKIKLKLTLEQFRFFDYSDASEGGGYSADVFKKFNKRLYDRNRRCESADEWLSDELWRNAWLYKVEELAKRYSGDTEIFAIELWNEMNCVGEPKKYDKLEPFYAHRG